MKTLLSLKIAGVITGLLLSLPVLAQQGDSQSLIAKGQYLAVAGDCGACHTNSGGKAFAGGLAINTPIGQIFSTNITPSKTAGIGNYTLEDFDKAVRKGIRKDGSNLYPAMPYTSYSKISDEDMKALYAYLMQDVQPVDVKGPETALPFPFNIRLSMAGWNLIFAGGKPFVEDSTQSHIWNRGAYLAEGLAHCSTCHTPRNPLMAEESGKSLAGASLGTWFAPNITSDPHSGIGRWTQQDLVDYLATGRADNGSQAGGPMLEAIDKSFSKLSPADLKAIATYIQSVPAQSINATSEKLTAAAPEISDISIMNGTAPEGAKLYASHCSTCHQASGQGGNGLPALYNNAALRRPVADNAVMAVLEGLIPSKGQAMPAFSDKLDDKQVATLVNYLFTTYGDPKVQTTPERVKALRQGGEPSPLLAIAKGGMIVLALLVLIFGWIVLRSRRKGR
ncbi:cytochrome c [Rouxiella badensis]|uniref:cytochrome c n=1 Tax=Rouxiella badensis TaxID=1646377 RepID=UPI001D14F2A5|nr:cytochrome c [Rouxiella badensis]MCC3721489.1 cytochrome c [Rouxiella badensis]MCC3731061.1 cytochrome c [Rouxiella badensis]MCC3735899.1 cytochrome c [Rouxiella badensis]MCC3742663.1 cytochrome c [Rouxiella badensis]MCC3761286.1 cytochrome c [Rouxiella badensis]